MERKAIGLLALGVLMMTVMGCGQGSRPTGAGATSSPSSVEATAPTGASIPSSSSAPTSSSSTTISSGTPSQAPSATGTGTSANQSGTSTEIHLPVTNKWFLVQLDLAQLKQQQDAEKDGHRPGLMIPEEVAMDFVTYTPDLAAFIRGTQNKDHFDSDGVIEVTIDQHTLLLHLVQPVQQGKFGIWAVDRYQVAQ